MLHITNLEDGVELFKALASETRISILEQLLANREMRMGELADSLNISEGTLVSHIKRLEKCGVLPRRVKNCRLPVECAGVDKILIEMGEEEHYQNVSEADIRVGQYCSCEVSPSCGLATSRQLIGKEDDPKAFYGASHMEADILWFSRGFVEYLIPYFVPEPQRIAQIMVSMELNAAVTDRRAVQASDICFYLNDTCLGGWTGNWESRESRGFFTPDWWQYGWRQYGNLKLLTVNRRGTFVDGIRISRVSINQIKWNGRSPLRFRLEIPENGIRQGGLSIFGAGFGNYNQDMKVHIYFGQP